MKMFGHQDQEDVPEPTRESTRDSLPRRHARGKSIRQRMQALGNYEDVPEPTRKSTRDSLRQLRKASINAVKNLASIFDTPGNAANGSIATSEVVLSDARERSAAPAPSRPPQPYASHAPPGE